MCADSKVAIDDDFVEMYGDYRLFCSLVAAEMCLSLIIIILFIHFLHFYLNRVTGHV